MARISAPPLPTVTTTATATTATSSLVKNHLASSIASNQPPSSIEAKLVILGSQGVGKTSLVNRFINPQCSLPTSSQATIGASFVTKQIHDSDSNTTVRLQIWDTAGQERFRSISRLYYRGADAGLLCYDVTSERSWEEMKGWLKEMKENCDFGNNVNAPGMVIHVVGTKTDLVAADPDTREVTFERTISYVADQFGGQATSASQASTPPLSMKPITASAILQSPDSKRSSGFWTQDLGWDSCHEISARDNDGIEELFRVIARKLVEQRNKREAWEASQTPAGWTSNDGRRASADYFTPRAPGTANGGGGGSTGSFRIGYGDKRRSWLGRVATSTAAGDGTADDDGAYRSGADHTREQMRGGRCC